MKEKLINNLLLIAKSQNGKAFDEALFKDKLIELLEENGYDLEKNIPDWMNDLYDSISHKRVNAKTVFNRRREEEGDFVNFTAELEALIKGEYDFYGEGYELTFDKLGIAVSIMFEGTPYYRIKKI